MMGLSFFFFNDTATTEIYTLSLHDALPIWGSAVRRSLGGARRLRHRSHGRWPCAGAARDGAHAPRMFTSCGRVFDDIAGIETIPILRYAARAIEPAGAHPPPTRGGGAPPPAARPRTHP